MLVDVHKMRKDGLKFVWIGWPTASDFHKTFKIGSNLYKMKNGMFL